MSTHHPPPPARRLLLAAGVIVCVVVGGVSVNNLFRGDQAHVPVDFTAHWAAGRLAARGDNPYDPVAVRATQQLTGLRSDVAVMMWNPPWALALVMPFGLLPFTPAYGLWALTQIGLVVAAAALLWRGLAPGNAPAPHPWAAYLLALLFVPTTYLVGIGQITGFVLFGLAGFLVAVRRDRPVLAGTAAALTAAKPHLLVLFAAWLVLNALAGRAGRRVVLGGLLVGAAAAGVTTLVNPAVWGEYLRAATSPGDADHYGLANWMPPVIGGWVRAAIPGQPFWVQLAFPAAAAAGFVGWYVSRRAWAGDPDWAGRLPAVVGLSMLVAPYGAWPFDLVLLLVPVLAVAVRVAAAPTRAAVAAGLAWYAAGNAVLLAMMVARASSEWYVWVTPYVLAGCLVVRRLARGPANPEVPVARLPRRRTVLAAAAALLVVGVAAPQAWAWWHLRSARSALAAYHPGRARESLAACARVWGDRPDVRLLASRAARQAGDADAADRELRACQRLRGGASDDTAFEWALAQAAVGNVREVEPYLQKRAEESPEAGALVWEALTQGYLRVYRTLDAMNCANHWLKREPDNPRALELRGQVYVTGKGVVRGTEDYRRALELDPTRADTRWRLAGCLIDLGTYEEAAEHLERYARGAPGDPDVAARLARCYVMTQRRDEARRILDDALARHPESGPCLRARGQVALTGDPPDLAEAEGYLRRAVAALPDDYQANWSFAEALRQQGKAAEGKAQLARAEELRDRMERLGELQSRKLAELPLDPALHYEMGVLLLRGGHPDVGAQWLASALQLAPDHRPAHTALADYFDRKGDPARAAGHRARAAAAEKK